MLHLLTVPVLSLSLTFARLSDSTSFNHLQQLNPNPVTSVTDSDHGHGCRSSASPDVHSSRSSEMYADGRSGTQYMCATLCTHTCMHERTHTRTHAIRISTHAHTRYVHDRGHQICTNSAMHEPFKKQARTNSTQSIFSSSGQCWMVMSTFHSKSTQINLPQEKKPRKLLHFMFAVPTQAPDIPLDDFSTRHMK